jgi:hypothetical protein
MRTSSWIHLAAVFMLSLGLGLASNTAIANGAVYRWVDSEGNVNYGEHPPKGVEATLIKKGSKKRHKKKEDSNEESSPAPDNASTPEQDTGASTAPAKPRIKKNPEFCKRATANLKMLTDKARIRQRKANGEVHYLTEKEVEEQKEIARKAIKTHCP